MLGKINFYTHAFMSDNNVLRTIFMSFPMNGNDKMLKLILCITAAAVNLVRGSFESYASTGG